MADNISSYKQSGGITAKNVSSDSAGNVNKNESKSAEGTWTKIGVIAAVVGTIAIILFWVLDTLFKYKP
jgi:hypothetical protein